MIRNLKVLLLAALAVTAVGAIGASSASANHATAERFTNLTSATSTVGTTEPDGAVGSTTAHQVFDSPNGAITCNSVDLKGTVGAEIEPKEIILEEEEANKIGFTECKFLGQTATVKLEGCKFTFTPHDVSVTGCAGKEITFSAGGCTVKIPEQGPFKEAVKYENLGAGGNDMYVTAEVATKAEIKGSSSGAGCVVTGAFSNGQYTTGNTLLKGWSDPKNTQKPITVDFT